MSKELEKAIDDLSSLFEFGTLQASTDPVEFLNRVADEVKKLRWSVENAQPIKAKDTDAKPITTNSNLFECHKVKSAAMAEVAYCEFLEALYVMFSKGSVSVYKNVPVSVFRGLIKAESPGGYMHKVIKGTYEYKQVR